MLLARLSPKHRSGSSYQSNITSCARNIITSTGNHAAVRLVASSHIISCRPAARLWQSGIFNKSIISTCIGQSNFDTKGSFRLYSYRNQSRLPLDGCKTVEDVLQPAVKQREKIDSKSERCNVDLHLSPDIKRSTAKIRAQGKISKT